MRSAGLLGLALLVGGCAHEGRPTSFPADLIKPAAEDASDVTLTGWLRVEPPLTVYPGAGAYKRSDTTSCVFIRPLSMAGIVTSDYEGKRMAVTGRVERDAASPCGTGVAIAASDISVP